MCYLSVSLSPKWNALNSAAFWVLGVFGLIFILLGQLKYVSMASVWSFPGSYWWCCGGHWWLNPRETTPITKCNGALKGHTVLWATAQRCHCPVHLSNPVWFALPCKTPAIFLEAQSVKAFCFYPQQMPLASERATLHWREGNQQDGSKNLLVLRLLLILIMQSEI